MATIDVKGAGDVINATSHLHTKKATLVWTIKDYKERLSLALSNERKTLSSPTYSVPVRIADGKVKKEEFIFQLDWVSEDKPQYSGIYLRHAGSDGNFEDILVGFEYWVKKAGGKEERIAAPVHRTLKGKEGCGFPYAFMNSRGDLTVDGTLTLICDLTVFCSHSQTETHVYRPPRRSPDLGELMQSSKFSDFTIVCEEVKIPCHKAVLAARSDVFDAMLSSWENQECITGQMEMVDLSKEALVFFIHFLYTGPNLPPLALAPSDLNMLQILGELLLAAEKYNVASLKDAAEAQLSTLLNKHNMHEIAALADLHRAENLKPCVVSFLVKNYQDLSKNKNWKKIPQAIMDEVICQAMEKLNATTHARSK